MMNKIFALLCATILMTATAVAEYPLGLYLNHWYNVSGYTAKDYVQDGLIFQIDALENAGYGKYTTDLTWVDLAGDYLLEITPQSKRGLNYFEFSNVGAMGIITNGFVPTIYGTLELVVTPGRDLLYPVWAFLCSGSYNPTPTVTPALVSRITANGRTGRSATTGQNLGIYEIGLNFSTQTAEPTECVTIQFIRNSTYTTNWWYCSKPFKYTSGNAQAGLPVNIRTFGSGFYNSTTNVINDILLNVDSIKTYFNWPTYAKFHSIRIYSRALPESERQHNRFIDEQRFIKPSELLLDNLSIQRMMPK